MPKTFRTTPVRLAGLLLAGLVFFPSAVRAAAPAAGVRGGEQIYRDDCVRCHGSHGQGVAGKYDEALFGERSVESLAKLIAKTMPEDKPGTCTGEDAQKVAAYIYDAFYSPAAHARLNPPKIDPARLTVHQYRQAVADVVGGLRGAKPQTVPPGGLRAQYWTSRNFRNARPKDEKDKAATRPAPPVSQAPPIDRVDPRIEFIFENATPDPKLFPGDEFSVRWRGSVIAEDTGDYEFILRTQNGARLYVNNDARPLVDAWVASAGDPREHRATLHLLGGRAYPIRLDLFRMQDKTASVSLKWKPPHGPAGTIPPRHLSPQSVPETLVVATPFPADDASRGYERGASVSKAWHQASTTAAIEVANRVIEQADALAGTTAGASDRRDKVMALCARLAQGAFRRPLTAEEKTFFVDGPFKDAKDLQTGVKRSVLLVLKSPRFLYPQLGRSAGQPDPYDVASRLSFSLWDSVPDAELLKAAAANELRTPEQVAHQARRMLADPRARYKVRGFLHHWLKAEEAEDVSKDPKAYPDFNDAILASLRTSLDLFLDHVVWSKASDYRQLLLADYLYLDDRLATFYGVARQPAPATAPTPGAAAAVAGKSSADPGASDFTRVGFDPKQRSGVLTHPYLLAAFAYHRNSSPIHRGVFLTRSIVGRNLRPPPSAIQFMDDRFDPSLTMREKVAELTRPAACYGCHQVINPLGFSLENFDAVGRFRTTDNGKPVDATAEYLTSDGKPVRLTGPRDVAEHAAGSPEAHRAFVGQLFAHVVKQPPEAYGLQTLDRLRAAFVKNEFNIQSALVEIATLSALHGTESHARSTP